MNNIFRTYWLGFLISFLFIVVGIFTLKDYGLATDEVFHLLRGQAYLSLFITGNTTIDQSNLASPVLIKPGQRISEFRSNDWEPADVQRSIIHQTTRNLTRNNAENGERVSFYKSNYWNAQVHMVPGNDGGHPPVSDILAALTNNIFYERLGILGDIEAYNFYVLITGALLIFAVFYFANRNYGRVAGIISAVTLALYPFFFAESHFNLKDIPEMSFFSICLISFYFWVLSNKKKWFALFCLFAFLAVGTKLNAVFIPLIILPWLLFIRRTKQFKTWFSKKLITYCLLFIILITSMFVLSWPYLWSNTLNRILEIFGFYKDINSNSLMGNISYKVFGLNILGITIFITTIPVLTLILFFAGIVKMIKKIDPSYLFVLLWLFIPIARTLPNSSLFATLRQFAEFLPAVAIMTGIGAVWVCEKGKVIIEKLKLSKRILPFTFQLSIFTYVMYLAFINISYHPNQNLYFNFLSGGTKGAWEKRLLVNWQTPNDQEYRQVINWFNNHAEKNARIAFLDGSMFSISPLWLRPDIKIGSYDTGAALGGEYIISTYYYPKNPSNFPYAYADRFLVPIYELDVKGVPVIKVWKNDVKYFKVKDRNKILPAENRGN